MSYVVIENTPGYLPEHDDPATFDALDEARAYLRGEVERYCESVFDGGGDPEVSWTDNFTHAYVEDATRTHDLGRVWQIVSDEELSIKGRGA